MSILNNFPFKLFYIEYTSLKFIKYTIFYFFHIVKFFLFYNSTKMLGGMSHNVPAVYDVLAARIRALRSKDQGRQNVGGVSRGNGA
jgi:hypothetical protein